MGKKSLQNWRKTRLQQLTAQPSGRGQDSELLCDSTASQGKHGDTPQAAVFNADLLCEHGEKLYITCLNYHDKNYWVSQ